MGVMTRRTRLVVGLALVVVGLLAATTPFLLAAIGDSLCENGCASLRAFENAGLAVGAVVSVAGVCLSWSGRWRP
jgi:hypothetical protein